MEMKVAIIDRKKIRLTATENGINYEVTDTNRTRRCTAHILNVAGNGWNVRIDKNGKVWKYAANIKTSTPEAAYEYCQEFGAAPVDD
jgi:hypothetical protein